MDIFRKPYTLRRFGEQTNVGGYLYSPYEDTQVTLNVQPLTSDELEVLPEGDRKVTRLKAYGAFPIKTADQSAGTIADRLLYHGRWFECESSFQWDHTLLAHYESQFVAVAESDTMEEGGAEIDTGSP